MGISSKTIMACAIVFIATRAFGFSQLSLAKPYAISSIGTPVAKQCRAIMSSKHTRFAGGATKKNSCACIAKYAVSEISTKQLHIFTNIMSERLELANKTIKLNRNDSAKRAQLLATAQSQFKNIQNSTEISNTAFDNIMKKTSKYLKICGKRASHSGDNLKIISRMTPYKKDEDRQPDTRQTSSLRPAYHISSQENYTKLIAKSH